MFKEQAGILFSRKRLLVRADSLARYLDGTQSHLHFLPEGHTDFIIAAFSEEFGLLGVILLMFVYACILTRALYIAFTHPDTYSRLLAGAIAMSFFVYVFVNVGMVGDILPVVGVPLPFL